MSQKIKDNICVRELPHELTIKVIYTIKYDDSTFNEVNNFIEEKGFVNYNEFIKENSRHFDHIEELFLSKNNNLGKAYQLRNKNNPNNLENFIKLFPDFPFLKEKQNYSNFNLTDIQIISFSTKILFFIFETKINHTDEIIKFHDKLLLLKSGFKNFDIVNFIKNIVPKKTKLYFFDMSNNKEEKNGTTRFKLFINLCFKKNKRKENKNKKENYINSEELNLLSYYFTNRNMIKKVKKDKLKENDNVSLFYDNNVFCSEESIAIITQMNAFNFDLIDNTFKYVIQNAFYSYILSLHQYFYLHYLKIKIQKIDTNNSKILYDLNELENEYTIFQNKWLYRIVSQFEHQQKLYSFINSKLNIFAFDKEIQFSLKPLQELKDSKRQEKIKNILSIFNIFGISSSILSIFNIFVNFHLNDKLNTTFFAVSLICFITLFASLILTFVMIIKNKKIKIKKNIDKNKN